MKSFAYKLLTLIIVLQLSACSSKKNLVKPVESELSNKALINAVDFPILDGAWAGIVFRDLGTGQTILQRNEARYFRPASNTKILTLYNAFKALTDSLTTYEIYRDDKNRVVVPSADPTYLSPYFMSCGFANQLEISGVNGIDLGQWQQTEYGLGWMWDDFYDIYSLPMTAMPMFGNMLEVTVANNGTGPTYNFHPSNHGYKVALINSNEAYLSGDTIYLSSTPKLDARYTFTLKNALRIAMEKLGSLPSINHNGMALEKSVKNCPLDTIYKAMMYESDNFLAEYLLLNAGKKYTQVYNSRSAIDTLTKLNFTEFSHLPKWVDGSGMSHYNLINPTFLVELLSSMWKERGYKILHYFPEGGRQGTIKNWYAPQPGNPPYVFAKTGTISNVYCLSGYLQSKSGKTFAFSIMVNNFLGGATPVRREIQKLLEKVRERS